MTTTTRQRPPSGSRPPRPRTQARRPSRPKPPAPSTPLRLGNPRRRAGILLIFVLVVFTIFAGRLLELQAFRGDALAAAAVDQRTTTVKVLADRGDIVDARGVPLAMTVESRHVTVDQTLIADPLATAQAIAGVLGIPSGPLVERLTGDRRFAYVVKDITPEQWRIIDELGLTGIYSERTLKRIYPSGDVAANVVGFVGSEGAGLAGVEYALDDKLAGVDGWRTFERVSGVAIPGSAETVEEPLPGTPVQLTIDRDIQYVAQRALANEVMATGAESGSIVVMDPRTGDILALAVAPTFDANDPGSAEAADRGNRAITDVFEPGSTSKVITIAAVLEEGGATPSTTFDIPPTLDRGGKTFHDATDHGGYQWDLATILSRSSNIGTILAAETVPEDRVFDYFGKFGLGQPSGAGLPGESPGYLPPMDTWSATTFPTLTFGQGFSVNAIQMADVFSTIANDGVRMPARIVADAAPAAEGERVISERTAKMIREMLERVVADDGTAPMAGIPGYRVGGKTGTAQVIDPECGCYSGDTIGSFIGMAPIEDPELVVAVTIVKPKVVQMGGELAGPVFREVMTYALQAQRVAPITPQSR